MDDTKEPEQKIHILVVEDNPIVQKIHKKMLEDLDCHVSVAADGHQAIKMLIDDWSYSAILMDIGLPDVSGIHIAKRLKQIGIKQINSIPIFGITAYRIDELKDECAAAGFNEIFSKPISIENLKNILSDVTKKKFGNRD